MRFYVGVQGEPYPEASTPMRMLHTFDPLSS